jgi:protocatechuate 3,4-dioxygenase, beta subunit
MKMIVMFLIMFGLTFTTGCAQQTNQTPAGRDNSCEGCEAIYESPVPFDKLDSMVWLPDWKENPAKGTKLAVNGTVFKADGTPAAGVIIYIYHTDLKGEYPTKGDEKGWDKRHGYLRGWMKTNEAGFYKFFTLRPASYPNSKAPQHIHVIIKEPGKEPYWIDEYLFDDDPFLTAEERKQCRGRGGNGILTFNDYFKGKNFQKSERNIYLGKNIPGYRP